MGKKHYNILLLLICSLGLMACASSNNVLNNEDKQLPNTSNEATTDIENIVQRRDPRRVLTEANLAYQQSNLLAAKTLYEELLDINPNSTQANFRLGNIENINGNLSKAQTYYETALRMQPRNQKLHYNLATVHLAKAEDHLSFYTALTKDEEVEKAVLNLLYAIEQFSNENN